MNNNDRPLSPHISIYRWPVTMVSSILHRGTGIALSAGFVLFVFWLTNAADGPNAYAVFASVMGSTIGMILLIGWSFAFFFHLSNGVRHLVWDTGRGFEKEQATASGWFVMVFAFVLTAAFWGVVL